MSTTMTTGAEAPPQDDLLPETPAFATLITRDGRPVRLDLTLEGGISLSIGGLGKEIVFDRFQSAALRAAVATTVAGSEW